MDTDILVLSKCYDVQVASSISSSRHFGDVYKTFTDIMIGNSPSSSINVTSSPFVKLIIFLSDIFE